MFKRFLLLLFVFVLVASMQADAQQLNYQAIARNANGVALTFRDVGIRLSIRDGSPNGSIVYSESRNIRTNQFGLFTVIIGSPGANNVLGSMASINWISGNKYLQVEIDPEGGTNYFQAGTSQLQAVPYALFANAAYPVGPAGGDLLGSTYPNPIIAPLAVTTGKIANQAITTPKIADQAVTNAKIQDNTIANIKLVNSRVTLNGLILNLGDTQDFAIGTNGIDVNIVSAGNTHTFNFPDASIANRGLITPNAQTIGGNKTFNNDITAARIIRSGGLAAQFLKADGSVDNNIYLTENQPIIVTATGDATGVSTSSRTAPVLPLTLATVNSAVGTYGTNIVVPSITVNNKGLVTNVIANPIPTATAITSGLLTVGDWNIFNNKQNAIPLGSAAQYFRGDLTLSNFQTDVRNQLSAGTNITYANGNIGLTNNSVTLNTLPLTLGGAQTFATGTTGVDFNISSAGSVHTFNIPTASVFARGLISSTDYTNFNAAYNNRIASLTTTGTSGAATLSGNVLNIPNYTIAGLGGENAIASGTTLQYWRGDKSWQTLNSSVVPEGTNFYYTDTRSRNALSITTSGSNGAATYNSASGVFNIPAYTLNGLGGVPSTRLINGLDLSADRTFSTTDIAEGSRQYFTDTRARTSISLTTVGTGGLSTYDNTTGVLNIPNYTVTGLGAEPSITAGNALQYWRGDKSWQTLNTTVVPEGTNEYFTQAKSRSSISLTTTGTSGSAVYSPATGILNVPSYTLGGLGGETAITPGSILQYWRGDKSWQTLNTTVVPEGTNEYFTQAKARTSISLTTAGTNGAAAYDNTTGALNIPAYTLAGLGGVPTSRQINGVDLSADRTFTTTEINEGTNLYFNNTRARSAISLTTTGNSGQALYNNITGILNIPEYTIGGLGGVSTARTINGIDLSANQSFAVGTAGTTFNISGSGTTHSFNIPNSSTALVTGGLLSNTDWTTFNNKQSAISGTGYSKWAGSTLSFIPQIPLGTDVTGTLLAGNFGALTGDVTNTAGSYATTISNNAITTAKILNGSVTNLKLENSALSIGTTSISLGNSSTTLGGLTSVTSTNFIGDLTGNVTGNVSGSAGSVTNNLTFASDGSGAIPTSTFNGSAARIISYNSVGASPLAGSADLVTVGTITNGTWNSALITGQYGGTGVANIGKTITLGGDLTTAGAFATTLTSTGATNVTLPTTGTLATLAGTETFTNKTLTSPIINLPAISFTNVALSAGTDAQNSAAITNDLNIITTAASSPSGITLPVASAGRRVVILNRGANAVKVYPATGGEINSLGTNAAFSNIPANTYAEFYATSATQWYSANSATASTTQWNVLGNTGLNASNNFVGTTDDVALRFRVNNTFSGQIHPEAAVGNTSFGLETNSTTNNSSFNSAFGSYALRANTNSGVRNSAFGALTLASNNSGLDNTGVGQAALTSNLSGDNNTGIGQAALTSNSTGSSNTAVGQAALYTNSTTSNNTAVGRSALFASTGSNNTGIGHFALLANTTGSANTAVGQNSLSANTTTSNNTAVGWEALRSTTNNGNVGIGYRADVGIGVSEAVSIGINSNVTADNSIAIGRNSSATNINSIVLGNTASTTQQNTVSIGFTASTTNAYAIAIGDVSNASGENSIAIGKSAVASNQGSIAIGDAATNNTINSILLGGTTNTIVNATGALTATGAITAGGRITGTGARFAYRASAIATTLTVNDYYLKMTSNVQITMPDAATMAGQKFVIFNGTGGVFNNFAFSGAQTIVGASWTGLASDGSVTLFSDGANWLIESKN